MARRRVGLSPIAEDAARLLGIQIRLARQAKRWSAAELAERAGVSRPTVVSVESGSASVSVGNVFNIAVLAGVDLFGLTDPVELARARRRGEEVLALLPRRVDKTSSSEEEGDYDF